MSAKRICLVTPGHLASDPRLVKEADALHEAGYAVRVVAGDTTPEVRPLDAPILARAAWPVTLVGLGRGPIRIGRRMRQELARLALRRGIGGIEAAIWAHSPFTQTLAQAAAATPADLYIGHCLAALPAVASAARSHGAAFGFDAEDDHVGELIDAPENKLDIDIRRRIEARFLPHCRHLTAASPGIASAYRTRYGVTMTPVLNVFPLAHAPAAPITHGSRSALSIYWFSQTIGAGRGLEQIIAAMGRARTPMKLTIRGSDFLGYSAVLRGLAAKASVADAVSFLPPGPPDEMARLAAEHDVGLASEIGSPPNRAISLTNKIFVYLLAGIPVLLSDTPAQRELSRELGVAAQLLDIADPDASAAALDAWTRDENGLAVAKEKAWKLAHTRFNWEIEKRQFLSAIKKAIQ